MEKQKLLFTDLGKMDYQSAWDYQEMLLKKNVEAKSLSKEVQPQAVGVGAGLRSALPETEHRLLFVEHPPVYTLGKSGKIENILLTEQERMDRGVEFFPTNRGGDITFHGPGQLVAYPILDLEKFFTDIGRYLRCLEEIVLLTLAEYGIEAGRSPGETGVWLDADNKGQERKICAMGVRCSRWITMHGLALNVNTELGYFDGIIPCGIQHKKVTSLQKELGREINMEEVKEKMKRNFETVFSVDVVETQDSNQ